MIHGREPPLRSAERVPTLISELPRSRLDDFHSHSQRRDRRFPVPPVPRERLLWQEPISGFTDVTPPLTAPHPRPTPRLSGK